uniref:HTH_48 domain-containing protein n=1 Tax=Bursaphelenchus xylophilus TaxID=6326 RepID=A0A1I7S1D2_BURXY
MASPEAIKNQFAIWERLMHSNVKAHTALRSLNQFPRGQEGQKLLEQLEPEVRDKYMQVRKNTFKLLEIFQNIEAKLTEKSKKVEKREEDDDEIVSSDSEADAEDTNEDLDEELEEEEEEEDKKIEEKSKKSVKMNKSSLASMENAVQKQAKAFAKSRDAVLEKWFERTRLAVSKKHTSDNFDSLETSAVRQIDKGMKVTGVTQNINGVFGESDVSLNTVKRWFKKFRSDGEGLKDKVQHLNFMNLPWGH